MEQEKTYVVRRIAYEYNDATYDFVAEGGIEGYYHDYDSAYAACQALESKTLEDIYRLEYYPEVFNRDGTVNEACDRDGRGVIIADSGTEEEVGDIRRIYSGRFYTISVFETTPYFYIIETNPTYFEKEAIVDLDGIPFFFPSYEAATNHLGDCLWDFNLEGTPEALSDMPALLQQLFDSHPNIFEKDASVGNKTVITIFNDLPLYNEVLKILFELLREKPVTIKKVNIDYPALWSKRRHM